MGVFDKVMSATVGNIWEAASGTVDPWTKAQMIEDEAQAVVKASGGAVTYDQAASDAELNITATLQSTITASGESVPGDPSDFWGGVNNSIHKLGSNLDTVLSSGSKAVLFVGIGVILIAISVYVLPTFKKVAA